METKICKKKGCFYVGKYNELCADHRTDRIDGSIRKQFEDTSQERAAEIKDIMEYHKRNDRDAVREFLKEGT